MLTRSDETIVDCLDVWDAIERVGLRHAGFKDIGVDTSTLVELNRRMQASGVTTYLEVVSTSVEACLQSCARSRGDRRRPSHGRNTQSTKRCESSRDSAIQYLPFAGLPTGHPTQLGGDADLVERQCKDFEDRGCAGVDLLAYRATEADPLDLVRAARRGTSGYLVVAGSVSTATQIEDLSTREPTRSPSGQQSSTGRTRPTRAASCRNCAT